MYSLKAILDKQPAVIAEGVRTILFVLVLTGVVNLTEELLAGIALAVSVVLSLFVWNASTSKTYPTLVEGTSVKVEGSEDAVIIAKSPPGPTGVEGGAGQ